jgi:iron complex transport system substrate-binding protein
MNWKSKVALSMLLLACIPSCKFSESLSSYPGYIPLKYAKSFELSDEGDYKLLNIYGVGADSLSTETFKLVPRENLDKVKGSNIIPVPCKRIICLSSTQLTYFFALDNIDPIVAINSSRHLQHKEMNRLIEAGKVKKVGKEGAFNTELIASLNPDVIFVSPFKSGGYDVLKSLGFPIVPIAAYEEGTPLGRAEWIKVMAAFVGENHKADSLFNGVASRYETLRKLTAKVKHRPTIFFGKMGSGSWYVPGGESFYAQYFKDAGADYVVKDDKKAAYPLDFETMYAKAANADFWRLLITEPEGFDKKALLAEDPRYGNFKAFKTGNIIACNINIKAYYEENAMKPDVLLSDYIHFLHPELLPNHKPQFYEILK